MIEQDKAANILNIRCTSYLFIHATRLNMKILIKGLINNIHNSGDHSYANSRRSFFLVYLRRLSDIFGIYTKTSISMS